MAELGSQVIALDGAKDTIDMCEAERAARQIEGVSFLQATFPDADEASR